MKTEKTDKEKILDLIVSAIDTNIFLALQLNQELQIFDFESLYKEIITQEHTYRKMAICRRFLAEYKKGINWLEFQQYLQREKNFTDHILRVFVKCLQNQERYRFRNN